MVKPAKHFYEFGPFRVDVVKRRLLRDSAIVPLTPKAFDTLLVLVEHSGQVVEKDDLMDKVWPGIAVEENNLTQNISMLRKALGERRAEPQYILTVSRLGYRFIAAVSEHWQDESDDGAPSSVINAPAVAAETPVVSTAGVTPPDGAPIA